ncbi:MAG: Glycosyl-4,4'-diaponeurosporenoate acyltransferase [Clostridium sp.]
MLKNLSFLDMLIWNLVIVGLWHITVFLLCIKLPKSAFDPTKERYAPRQWEHGGRWYRDTLKIQVWKDRVPQYIGKNGFSKRHLNDISIEYLDEFITETCRGEWMHLKNCICAVVTLIINPLLVGLVMSFLIMLANAPFAAVQRYNRFRLLVLRKKRLRDIRSNEMEQNTVTA